jgi:hypothetical protein
MSYAQEFETVDLILASNAETRAVDGFALSLIKCERQMRRLLTHLIFQYPCFGFADIPALRSSLSSNRKVYFEGFVRGFDTIYPRSIRDLVGQDYGRLRPRLDEAIDHRNKIFHGQLTSKSLTREDLFEYVSDIRSWCKALADAALAEIGYDGFVRDSFRKSEGTRLWERYKFQLTDVNTYAQFIQQHMQRT